MDCIGVFGTIQAMQARRRRVRAGGAIEFVFQPGPKTDISCLVGACLIRWRHHTGTQLPDNLLPFLYVVLNASDVEVFQGKISDAGFIVVALLAVLVEYRLLRGKGRNRRRLDRRHSSLTVNDECERQPRQRSQDDDRKTLLHESTSS